MHNNRIVLYKHLTELKFRCFYLLLCLITSFLTCYNFCFEMVYIFTKPFLQYKKNFIFLDVTEFFYTNIEICLFFSIYLALPILVYQIWCFFIPSSYEKKRLYIATVIVVMIVFLYSAILLVYFYILPNLFSFLTNFMVNNNLLNVELQPRIRSYVYLACKIFMLFTFFTFLPLIFLFFVKKKFLAGRVMVGKDFLSNAQSAQQENNIVIFQPSTTDSFCEQNTKHPKALQPARLGYSEDIATCNYSRSISDIAAAAVATITATTHYFCKVKHLAIAACQLWYVKYNYSRPAKPTNKFPFFNIFKNTDVHVQNTDVHVQNSCVYNKQLTTKIVYSGIFSESMYNSRVRNYFLIFILTSIIVPPDLILQSCVSVFFMAFMEILYMFKFIYIRILLYTSLA